MMHGQPIIKTLPLSPPQIPLNDGTQINAVKLATACITGQTHKTANAKILNTQI